MQTDPDWCPAGLLPKWSQIILCCLFLLHFKKHAYCLSREHTFKFSGRSMESWKASLFLPQGVSSVFIIGGLGTRPLFQRLIKNSASWAFPRITESEFWDPCSPHFKIGLRVLFTLSQWVPCRANCLAGQIFILHLDVLQYVVCNPFQPWDCALRSVVDTSFGGR